jgi:predicted house-cleaning noncanonical NTP pyrophosphatase (MazG superfamily)
LLFPEPAAAAHFLLNGCIIRLQRCSGTAIERYGALWFPADDEVYFVIHKFLPATVAAWALASPTKQVVLLDALWGLPDGFQYLSHDTFEYDVRRGALSSERLRYKPVIFQESETGEWKLTRVARKRARNRCLPISDIREVTRVTHAIAMRLGKAVQVMWFCSVDERAGVGRNIPWFMLDGPQTTTQLRSIAPGLVRCTIQTEGDLANLPADRFVLDLEPEASLFRNEAFLDQIVEIALHRHLPVVMRGSTLGHAYYTLERKGVSVVATDSTRTRTRQRQVFKKLVRDEIPTHIVEQGEKVTVAKIAKSESRAALVIKIYEETQELLAAQTPQEVTAELADLLEIIRSLCLATGIDFREVERAADAKRGARGSFSRNVVLLETSWPTWKERPIQSDEATISLHELGQVFRTGKLRLVNFAAAVSQGGAIVELKDGTQVAVRIVDKGIELKELESVGTGEAQLSFEFEEQR